MRIVELMVWFAPLLINHLVKKRHNNIDGEWRVTGRNAKERVHAFPIKSWESKASSYGIDTTYIHIRKAG